MVISSATSLARQKLLTASDVSEHGNMGFPTDFRGKDHKGLDGMTRNLAIVFEKKQHFLPGFQANYTVLHSRYCKGIAITAQFFQANFTVVRCVYYT